MTQEQSDLDPKQHNRISWDKRAAVGDRWSQPVDSETIARARKGDWEVVLTPVKPVPLDWFGDIVGRDILGLASGGGQQCPIFAAAGAHVTSLDASENQLQLDRKVAEREGLQMRTVQGYMDDLSAFGDESFDLIFHPCSNCFAPEILPVWQECARVLRPGGALLVGFTNPIVFIFDALALDRGELIARHKLPMSEFDLPEEEREQMMEGDDKTLCFSHTLETQIGGQMAAGLHMTAMFEDNWDTQDPLSELFDQFIATRAIKPN